MDNKDEYVVAKGIQGDLIASYEFRIHVGGEYSIWLLAFGTSTMDNGVTFRIDDLDNYFWQTTFIEKGRPIWTQYMYEVRNSVDERFKEISQTWWSSVVSILQ